MKYINPKYAISVILMTMVFFTYNAQADAGFFAGANYSRVSYSESYGDLDFATTGVILGYNVSSAFAIEGRQSKGSSGDDVYGYGVKIDNVVSVFGRFSLQNSTPLTPYALLGYTRGKMTIEDIGSDTEGDMSYGFGLEIDIVEGLSVAAEYIVLMDKSDFDITTHGLVATYTF